MLLYILTGVIALLGLGFGYIPNKHEIFEPMLVSGMQQKRLTVPGKIFFLTGALIVILTITALVFQYKRDNENAHKFEIQHSNDSLQWERNRDSINTSLDQWGLKLTSKNGVAKTQTNNYYNNYYNSKPTQ